MKAVFPIIAISLLLSACEAVKRMADEVYIKQLTSEGFEKMPIDSVLIVANGNSATQRIMEDVIPILEDGLKKRGINSVSVFISYSEKKVNEKEFDNRNYSHTLWIYEQDRELQKLGNYNYLVPLAMKLTENKTYENVWIATTVYNDHVKNKFYKEKYAGLIILLFRANGIIR